ncbi:phage holin family protein [Microbacterium barkeri]|uniref:phage holin family protein n=1 Tax=Microbacterium barkeri TaxID=33917 RepID=UPI0024AEAFBC|nr:phage holin family protein [Microbacterium barkeri]MDI6942918.1 phage holin family protein [Microbacterium barkeri]
MRFVIRVVVNAFAIWIVSLIPFLHVTVTPFAPGDDLQLVLTLLAIAAVFAIVNTIVGTAIKIVAFPLFILTLGLISLLLNGVLLWVTAWVMSSWGWGLGLDGFWPAVLAGILISIINWLFGVILRPQQKRAR